MGKYAFIDNIFGTDDEEQPGANDAFDESEDDESEEDDDDLPEEDDAALARLDKEFRKQRTRIRAMADLSELRALRADHAEALGGRQTPTVRLRTQDLIEEIDIRVTDIRVTDIRASRGPRGS